MIEVVPALLGNDPALLGRRARLVADLVGWFHLDVADGSFAPLPPGGNWPPENLSLLPDQAKVEVHLMVAAPERALTAWLHLADRLLVHQEAVTEPDFILSAGERAAVKVGVAVLLDSPWKEPEWYERFDLVQLMGIENIGYQGQPFDPRVVERVKVLRTRCPSVKIAVDGGVGPATAAALVAAGADQLVVGSALWSSDEPRRVISELQAL